MVYLARTSGPVQISSRPDQVVRTLRPYTMPHNLTADEQSRELKLASSQRKVWK
jgi:hypothetical protein